MFRRCYIFIHWRLLFFFALFMLCPLVAKARPFQFDAAYGIYWLGLPVYGGTVQVNIRRGTYYIGVSNKSRGIMNLIKRARHEIRASGKVNGMLLSMQQYHLLSILEKKRIRLEIRRNKAGLVQARRFIRPLPLKAETRKLVSNARMSEAFDPAAGFIFGVMRSTYKRPCARTVPFFDGLRRFNVAFSSPLERSYGNHHFGIVGDHAVLCRIHVQQIAGFTETESQSMTKAVERTATVRFVWSPTYRIWFPIRIEYASKWGPISIAILRVWSNNSAE